MSTLCLSLIKWMLRPDVRFGLAFRRFTTEHVCNFTSIIDLNLLGRHLMAMRDGWRSTYHLRPVMSHFSGKIKDVIKACVSFGWIEHRLNGS